MKVTALRMHQALSIVCLLALGGALSAEETAPAAAENPELAQLYAGDQDDRKVNMHEADWDEISKRDAERRARVLEIVGAGQARVAADYFHAAMVFQHGQGIEDIRQARDWAKKATELASDPASKIHRRAKWLFAAATDRHLHRLGEPQIFGTQFRRETDESPWSMEPFDREAISPEERKAHGVPTIEQQEGRLATMNSELEERGLLKDPE
ncbi:MAG: hypothetical protein AAGM22_27320 [Acidobacteriota bacterium]